MDLRLYGIHILFWALNQWVKNKKVGVEINHLDASFIKPLVIEEEAELKISSKDTCVKNIEVLCEKLVIAEFNLTYSEKKKIKEKPICDDTPLPEKSVHLKEKNLYEAKGSLDLFLSREIMRENFPDLLKYFSNNFLATLLASTRLVGMYCPGLNSIYSNIKLEKMKSNYNNLF